MTVTEISPKFDRIEMAGVIGQVIVGPVGFAAVEDQTLSGIVFPGACPDAEIRLYRFGDARQMKFAFRCFGHLSPSIFTAGRRDGSMTACLMRVRSQV